MSTDAQATPYSGKTAWARNLAAPVRDFLSTETGGAMVMLAATVLALLWANSPWRHSYESVWTTRLSITLGAHGLPTDLRHWVNEGLMTLFFMVVGLEAKRELDLGELRERRRLAIPVFAAIGGMVVPSPIYLAFNAGRAGAHGWGAAMSTDTAFALGALALLTPRTATRMRVFLLTLAVVDDLGALLVIAIVYTTHVSAVALVVGRRAVRALLALRLRRSVAARCRSWWRSGCGWRCSSRVWTPSSRVWPSAWRPSAYPPSREDLERATDAHALVPRAAHARAGALRATGRRAGDLAQRAPAVRPAPVDELCRSCRCSRSPTRACTSRRRSWATPSARRSRSASCSATSWASRSASRPALDRVAAAAARAAAAA